MNVVIEVARSPQNDYPDQQHETNRYDRRHLLLPRPASFQVLIVKLRLSQSIAC